MSFNVVMTGATGFIGAATLKELQACGANVTVLLRKESNRRRLVGISGYGSVVYSELLANDVMRQLKNRKPEIFIHCGWKGVGGRDRNNASQITANVPATIRSVELAARTGCRQWIGLGSQAEYGNQNCRLNECAPLQPTTLYGKAKLVAGISAMALCDAYNMSGVWLRVFSTYGPGDDPRWFIPYVIREFLSGQMPKLTKCEQRWDYLYVDDAARAIRATADGALNGFFNLGSGFCHPLRDYIEAIKEELGTSLEPEYGSVDYRPDQVMHLEADIDKLVKATGWIPHVSMAEGVRATVEYERLYRQPL